MLRAIIAVGMPASGKSTEFQQKIYRDFNVIDRNIFRRKMMHDEGIWTTSDNMWSKWKFTEKREAAVTAQVNKTIDECALQGIGIICSNTNLNEKDRTILIAKLEQHGYRVEIMDFEIGFVDACVRNSQRRDTVNHKIMVDMYQRWLEYKPPTRYVPNTNKPSAVIFDIDGTLAQMGSRSGYDWHKVDTDIVNSAVADLLRYATTEHKIIIMSGRDSVCKEMTIKWLADNRILYHEIHMRAEKDVRRDSTVKAELFWNYVAHNYNVKWVCDDRPQVIRLWQEMGLWTFNVGKIDREF